MKHLPSLKIDHRLKLQIFLCIACIYTEVCFHLFVFGFAQGLGFIVLCGCLLGCLFALLCAFLPELVCKLIACLLFLSTGIFSCAQLIYFKVFGNLMQLSLIRMGGDVFANFGAIIKDTMLQNWFEILLLLLPFILTVILTVLTRKRKSRSSKNHRLISLCGLLVCLLLTVAAGFSAKEGTRSAFSIAASSTATTEYSYQRLGLSGGIVKDLTSGLITNDAGGYQVGIEEAVVPPDNSTAAEDMLTVDGYDMSKYNVLNIDFEALTASTDNAALKALDAYFASVAPTSKNEYTGLLSGYNLITVCAESFSPYLISKEYTPTLYKLSTNGILFENFYGTYQSLTSNGEYTMCTGLYPNMLTTSAATSFEDSIDNYLPFCLGNSLSELDYQCFAYHSNVGEFYSRNLSHPNMGYTFRSAGNGLDINILNPASDLELFEQSVADYAESGTPFHAYYMSWSGHNPYNWTNAMSERNRSAVADMAYSDAVKAYLACNLELEYGLSYLLDTLEANGIADKTVIVLTTDHFPYGLTEEEYNELAGTTVETTFEKYKNAFICYVPGLEENIQIDEYCSTADILPTLLNLFGVNYDSRLLAGRDVLSDGIHVAVLANKSFLTDEFRFNTANGTIADESVTDANGFTQADYQRYISNLFAVSADMLENDYYAHVFSVDNGSSDAPSLVSYSDIQNVFHKSAVQYVITAGLMQAESEEIFGGENVGCVGELAEVFCKITGANFESTNDALGWALENGILSTADAYSADTPLTHDSCAVLMARFAAFMEKDTSLDDTASADAQTKYPEFNEETVRACLWATEQTVINKTMDFIYENRDAALTRFQLAAYVSYLCTHTLGL